MKIAKNNLAYPLLKDMFMLLGGSKCAVLSVLDLKDAFHSLRLTESSKKYCGIPSYFGSTLYLYQRMPMGLNISPAVWQLYINAILSCLSSRKYCETIMDDLLLFTPNKQTHFEKLVLCRNGLKISPKKCQLFRTELQYMGNTIFIKEKRVDHLAITHIMKSKMEPATNRIKRLLEVLSSYSFNLYYIKGKDTILNDFLSRQIEDDSNPHEIIPISFNTQEILQESYHGMVMDTYNVQMRAQVKAQANAPTAVDTQPITQKVTPNCDKLPSKMIEESNMKRLPSRIIQQSEGIALPPETIFPPVVVPPNIRPPLKLPNVKETIASPNLGPDLKMDIEENLPHQEGIITKTYVDPD